MFVWLSLKEKQALFVDILYMAEYYRKIYIVTNYICAHTLVLHRRDDCGSTYFFCFYS